jgi:small conductance mechanosensitive channel
LTEPFVLVDDLMDHAVRYTIYGLLKDSSELLTKRPRLRQPVLDTLYNEGVEIMSPSIVDRREHGVDHRFVPDVGEPAEEESEDAEKEGQVIEEVAIDRAEEAESIEQLDAQQEKLNHELEGASEDAATGEDRAAVKERLAAIETEIEKREQAKEKQRLDENSSE